MEDPFALIFDQAAAQGLRLNNLYQNGAGEFIANWRRDNATVDGQSTFANICTSTDPFHALKDSLAVAVRTIPAPMKTEPAKVEAVEDFGDLF